MHASLPLYRGLLELPGSSGSVEDCRRDFRSLVLELCACMLSGKLELEIRELQCMPGKALQIWQLKMRYSFRPVFASDKANRLAARRLNNLLVSRLWYIQDMLDCPDAFICAPLFVLVCASVCPV